MACKTNTKYSTTQKAALKRINEVYKRKENPHHLVMKSIINQYKQEVLGRPLPYRCSIAGLIKETNRIRQKFPSTEEKFKLADGSVVLAVFTLDAMRDVVLPQTNPG